MKRIVSLLLVCILMVGVLASCGSNVSESYAKKINDAATEKKNLTYAEVIEDLGDEAIPMIAGTAGYESGLIIAVKGVTNEDELKQLVDEGEEIEGLVVTILLGKATAAKYGKIDENTFK